MFHGRKNQYSIKKVAGSIHVPYDFTPDKLKDYVDDSASEARSHAREYIKSQKTQSRINEVLARSRNQ